MKLVLLVSMKNGDEEKWSLAAELRGAAERGQLSKLMPDGVARVGRDALLFDVELAHRAFVQVCEYLIRKAWPYIFVQLETASELQAEGTCAEALQAILGRKPAR